MAFVFVLPGCGLLLQPGLDDDAAIGRDAGADSAQPSVDASVMPPVCDELPCRVAPAQCGCAEGLSCQYETDRGRFCAEPGPGTDADFCMAQGDCMAGLACARGFGTSGLCSPYCEGDADCPGDDRLCVTVGGTPELPTQACSVSCDPITGDGCRGVACDVFGVPAGYITLCRDFTPREPLQTCADLTGCDIGQRCVNVDTLGQVCLALCELTGGSTCPAGNVCASASEPIMVGTRSYGFCVPA